MGVALCVRASMRPFLPHVALRVFSSSPLFLRLYTGYRARQRTLGRREEYTSPFIVIFRKYTLLLYPVYIDL